MITLEDALQKIQDEIRGAKKIQAEALENAAKEFTYRLRFGIANVLAEAEKTILGLEHLCKLIEEERLTNKDMWHGYYVATFAQYLRPLDSDRPERVIEYQATKKAIRTKLNLVHWILNNVYQDDFIYQTYHKHLV